MIAFFVYALLQVFPNEALARDYCFFQQGTYDGSCLQNSGVNKVAGGSFPSVSDAFTVNPASLPIISTPWGVEGIISNNTVTNATEGSYSLVRGFKKIGAGMATNNDKSFYSLGLSQIYENTSYSATAQSVLDQYSKGNQGALLGTAVGLPFSGALEKITVPSLGLAFKYNRFSGKWDLVWGISLNTKFISLGYSAFKDSPGVLAPEATTVAFSAGMKLPYINVDYTFTKYTVNGFTSNMRNLTGTLTIGPILISYANRNYNNVENRTIDQTMAAVQATITKKFTLGAFMGYIPNTVSLGAQLYL